MRPIKKLTGTISSIRELSPTAREYTIIPHAPLPFTAGAFVNAFIEHKGKVIRRAFSMSSSDRDDASFTLSIRHTPQGELTPILWGEDFIGRTIKLMGPLGLNTADKIKARKIYLFGFGVGAGVVKSLADHIERRSDLESLTITTGNRSVDEIIHKDYFDALAMNNPKVAVSYVVSDPAQALYPKGYIQDHIHAHDFNHADVYACGQRMACKALEVAINEAGPQNCNFFIEDFH
jgi:NAD(P)H-flavin reductase